MKKTTIALTLMGLLASSTASAETFLYGNCKPVKGTEFYRCLSIDDQITYTNILPCPDDAAAYAKARRAKEKERARLRALKSKEMTQFKSEPGKTEVIVEAPKQEPELQVVQRDPAKEQPKVDPCIAQRADIQKLEDQWGDLALIYASGNHNVDVKMTTIEMMIGHMLDSACFAEK